MFLGEVTHSLDAKGRVVLPARYREQLGEGAVMAKGLDGCLAIYPAETFERVAARVRKQAKQGSERRWATRAFFGGAVELSPDKQGRVAIPQHLRDFARLERDVVLVGNYRWIEVWDAGRYHERQPEADASIADPTDFDDFGM